MSDEYLNMCNEFSHLISAQKDISGNSIMEILKKYSSAISVFDMMEFTSQVIEENKYVQESYRNDSQKSYIESFLMRIKDISNDNKDYPEDIDRQSFIEACEVLNTHYENLEDKKSKVPLIFDMASIYATFVLKDPIHPVGTPFPGSLKVEEKDGKFLCPVKDANRDTPNAVCNICLAEQLDF